MESEDNFLLHIKKCKIYENRYKIKLFTIR